MNSLQRDLLLFKKLPRSVQLTIALIIVLALLIGLLLGTYVLA
ncbi:MAG: hypothetical protein NUV98_00655 [Candidatus Roizmanbacteria bacterium]|nr:hypothetical protein [Candidatus Roizmanbacteria bacterium]